MHFEPSARCLDCSHMRWPGCYSVKRWIYSTPLSAPLGPHLLRWGAGRRQHRPRGRHPHHLAGAGGGGPGGGGRQEAGGGGAGRGGGASHLGRGGGGVYRRAAAGLGVLRGGTNSGQSGCQGAGAGATGAEAKDQYQRAKATSYGDHGTGACPLLPCDLRVCCCGARAAAA